MPRSILIATHEYLPYPGGIGRYCAALAGAAAAAGHRVEVLAPAYDCLAGTVRGDDGVTVHRFVGDTFRLAALGHYRAQLRGLLDTGTYHDVLAADWPAILALGPVATPSIRRLATIYGTEVLMFRRSWRLRLLGAERSLRSFDRMIGISDFTRDLLARNYPALAARTEAIPLGVDAGWFRTPGAQAVQAFRNRCRIDDGSRIVLTVARLDSRKGHDRTIDALGRLPDALRARLRYLCVGRIVDEAYAARLRELAAARGVDLLLTGPIPDAEVLAAYHSADVFALTANAEAHKVEGFGLVLLEAAAQGLPSVVTPVDAIPEVIDAGRTGFIAATPKALANAFETLLTRDRSLWRAGCIDHALRFTWDACARATFAGLASGSESLESRTETIR